MIYTYLGNPTSQPSTTPTVEPTIPTYNPTPQPVKTVIPTLTTAAPTQYISIQQDDDLVFGTTTVSRFGSPIPVSFSCPSYNVNNTNSATRNYATCTFECCGGRAIQANVCGSNRSSFIGDTFVKLYQRSTLLTENDGIYFIYMFVYELCVIWNLFSYLFYLIILNYCVQKQLLCLQLVNITIILSNDIIFYKYVCQ